MNLDALVADIVDPGSCLLLATPVRSPLHSHAVHERQQAMIGVNV